MNKITLFIVLIIFGFLTVMPRCDQIKEKEKKLQEVKQELENEKKKEGELSSKEEEKKYNLKEISERLEKKSNELKKHLIRLLDNDKMLKSVKNNITNNKLSLEDSKKVAALRIRVFSKIKFIPALMSDGVSSFYCLHDFLSGSKVFGKIMLTDAGYINSLENNLQQLEVKKVVLAKDKNVLEKSKAKKENEKEQEEIIKKEEEKNLKKIKEELKETRNHISRLASEAKDIEKFIKALSAKSRIPSGTLKKEAKVFEREKDNLPWPVAKGRIVTYFGWMPSEKDNKANIFNPGVEIEVKIAQVVTSVKKGKVLFGGSFRSYGKMIIIDHGGGYCSVYSGLSEMNVKSNQIVTDGESIGKVSSVLHFEMRKDSKPIDPLEWLINK